jgi:predicted Rossmann fold nucleotide-binding protein DprA/Smf involved in DNA uptake
MVSEQKPSFSEKTRFLSSATLWGSADLLQRPSLALFCSAHAPAGVLLQIHDLAQHWRRHGPVIVSGFHSPAENEALTMLLRGPQPLVHVLARGMLAKLSPAVRTAIDEERLLLVSPFAASLRRATAESAYTRNRIVAALADAILVAYAGPGSSTASLVEEVRTGSKPLFTLDHNANRPLLDLGFHPVSAGKE